MDHEAVARIVGREVAVGTTVYSAQIEARVTRSPIHQHPVSLEPPFRPFDPMQTFERTTRPPTIASNEPAGDWRFVELILPNTERPDLARTTAFIASLAALQTPWMFHVTATNERVAFRLGAPAPNDRVLTRAWQSAFPDGATAPTDDPTHDLRAPIRSLCDYYLPGPYHRLLHASTSPWPSFLRLTRALKPGDIVWLEVLAKPTRANWSHNISALAAAEVLLGPRAPFGRTPANNLKTTTDPISAVAYRIASTDENLAQSLEAFAGTYNNDGQPLKYRKLADHQRVISDDEIRRFLQDHTTHVTGQLLTPPELALLIHPPTNDADGQQRCRFLRGLSVPAKLQSDGILLGANNDRGTLTRVVQPVGYNQNAWMIGTSGKGKSNFLLHLALRRAQRGQGLCLIDPHRTTATKFLATLKDIDPSRITYLDFEAPETVTYNAFAGNNEEDYGRLSNEYATSLRHLIGAEGFHRINHLLSMSAYALLDRQENVASIIDLLARTPRGETMRRQVINSVQNETVRAFWSDDFPRYTPESVAPIIARLTPLLLDERSRRVLAQKENTINIPKIMETAGLLIVAPPANEAAATPIGELLIAQLRNAAFRRKRGPHFHLIIDEFHRFITSATTLQSILAETAKFNLAATLAHQELSQLPAELVRALHGVPSVFAFGINLPDAKTLAPLFNGHVAPETLASQKTGQVHARLNDEFANFTVDPPPTQDPDVAARIIAESKSRYYTTNNNSTTAPTRRARIIETITEE